MCTAQLVLLLLQVFTHALHNLVLLLLQIFTHALHKLVLLPLPCFAHAQHKLVLLPLPFFAHAQHKLVLLLQFNAGALHVFAATAVVCMYTLSPTMPMVHHPLPSYSMHSQVRSPTPGGNRRPH